MRVRYYLPAMNRRHRFPEVQFTVTNARSIRKIVHLVDSQRVLGNAGAFACAGSMNVPHDSLTVFESGGKRAWVHIDDCGTVQTARGTAYDATLRVERALGKLAAKSESG